MTPDRWTRMKEIFSTALEAPEAERNAYLESACGADAELRAEIERLLAGERHPDLHSPVSGIWRQPEALSKGAMLGGYRIEEKLGEGGMGVVYAAEDMRLHRIVALKILPRAMALDPQRLQRFQHEAQAVAALNHPNVVTLYGIDQADGLHFVTMELVTGNTLTDMIPRHGFAIPQFLEIAVPLADAISAAHQRGIIHRDLKPGNIMVTEQAVVKVLDFGLAKLTETGFPSEHDATRTSKPATEEGNILGTAAYMSPEQAEGKVVDARSDIFSFGSLMYEMLTGRRAFQGDTAASTIAAVLREEPKPVSQVAEGLPGELERIVRRSLRKEPEHRFQTMADLKVALEEIKEESDSAMPGAAQMAVRRRSRRLVWAAALLAALALGVGASWFVRSIGKAPEPPLSALPLTTYPGYQGQPTFSPDGNQVAFVWSGERHGSFDIFVKLIDTAAPPFRLTNDPAGQCCPAWSPDGRYIGFLRNPPDGRTGADVMVVPALGGPERKIGEAFRPMPGSRLVWSPDAIWLVISDKDSSAKQAFALFLLSIETGERRRLTAPPQQSIGDGGPAFSPDGRTLAFSRSVDWGVSELYALDLSGGLQPLREPRQLTFRNRCATSPAWTPDSREIVFVDWPGTWSGSPSSSLWRVALGSPRGRPAEPQRLASLGENAFDPVISGQGRRLAFGREFLRTSIWRIAVPGRPIRPDKKSWAPASHAERLTASTRNDAYPQFSRDGKRITFVSDRSGHPEIWACGNDGSNAVQLTSFAGPAVTTPRWSPDGARIAFDSTAAGNYDIWLVAANGGKPQRITTHPANDGNPSWSHDGRWIYFDSSRTGQQEVFKTPVNGGEALQVTRDGGWSPLESPDGMFLYYTKGLKATSVWKMPVGGGPASKILDGLSLYINVAVVNDGIYFIPAESTARDSSIQILSGMAVPGAPASVAGGFSIEFLSFATNKITQLGASDKPPDWGLAVSPDGNWILCTQIEQAGSELMLVKDFH